MYDNVFELLSSLTNILTLEKSDDTFGKNDNEYINSRRDESSELNP